jgi:methyltransferase (TIGR00027 family)
MTQQDLRSGVELTAVFIAASRAIETEHPDCLVSDPYAAAFVRAASMPGGGFTARDETGQAMAAFVGIRSRFFDTVLVSRTPIVRQVVLLAAGFDARAYRLQWPATTTVYELDRPAVIDFKEAVLTAEGAVPSCDRRAIGVDLQQDWALALTSAGFDRTQPTLWLAEGLLMYLPSAAQTALLDTIRELSTPGSTVALDHIPDVLSLLADNDFITISSLTEGFDARALFNAEPKQDPAIALSRNGWQTASVTALDVARGYGRELPFLLRITAHYSSYLVADLPLSPAGGCGRV